MSIFQALLLLSAALFTNKVLLPADLLASFSPWYTGNPPIPQNANLSDLVQQGYPNLYLLKQQWQLGNFPLWNPYVLGGTPFHANNISTALFPVTWLVRFISPENFFEWSALLKLVLGGVGVYVLCRRSLSASPLASWSASAVYIFSGYPIYFLGFSNTYVTSLLPWLILTAGTGFGTGSGRARWCFSLMVGLILAAGHIESGALALLFSLVYALILISRTEGTARTQGRSRMAMLLFVHALLGVLTAASIWLTFTDYLAASSTLQMRTQPSNPYYISLLKLPAMFVPYYFGSPIFKPALATVAQMEQCIFTGSLPLLVAALGLRRRADPRLAPYMAGAACAFLITFGVWPFFHLFTSIPVLKQGNHIHGVQIFQFCVAVIFASGLDRWRRSAKPSLVLPLFFLAIHLLLTAKQWYMLPEFPFLKYDTFLPAYALLGLLLLLAFTATAKRPALAGPVLSVLLPLHGLAFAWYFNPAVDPSFLKSPAAIQEIPRESRIIGYGVGTLMPNFSVTLGLRDLRGYEPVLLSRTQDFFRRLIGPSVDYSHSFPHLDDSKARVLEHCAVQYVISPVPLNLRHWEEERHVGAFVYRSNNSLPRVQLVTSARGCKKAECLEALLAGWTENTAYIEDHSAVRLQQALRSQGQDGVELLSSNSDRLHYRIQTTAPAYVLVRDTFAPGWKALVNSSPAPVLKANYLFMAVSVPAGESSVELYYQPWSWTAGLALTLMVLPIVIGGIIWPQKKLTSMAV